MLPLWQKKMIAETNRRGKIVITATQMLESMITAPRPTRAEASDVANAVLDGTDALMLSGETASGHNPVEAVRTMARIIVEVEHSEYYRQNIELPTIELAVSANAIAHAAVTAARAMKIKVIAAVTGTGSVVRLLSEYRPEAHIVALTSNNVTYRVSPRPSPSGWSDGRDARTSSRCETSYATSAAWSGRCCSGPGPRAASQALGRSSATREAGQPAEILSMTSTK